LPPRPGAIYDSCAVSWDDVERLLDDMAAQQEAKVIALARRIVPHVTPEDLRNPHDFAPLVESAEFNYEDGILTGLRAAAVAVRAARRGRPD
jgi:hypothetical protein